MQRETLFSLFPECVRQILMNMEFPAEHLQEMRIRSDRPMILICGGCEYLSDRSLRSSQIRDILSHLGGYSLYAYENELRQGFLTLSGGHRVGIAGKVILEGDSIRTMTEISSLNIRFAHEIKGCADEILPWLWEEDRLMNTLLISPPGGGKTTLLRDCIRQLADGSSDHKGLQIGVVDERSEIAGCCQGSLGNDMGLRTDVLTGCPKAEGMMLLIRSMAPQAVAVDELGGPMDLNALWAAANCGCSILATVHGNDMDSLVSKPILREMIESGLFGRYVFLGNGRRPGEIRKILDAGGNLLRLEGEPK